MGGVAYTGSFTWGDDTPGFVFPDRLGPNNAKMVAECCTHESGHTVGLVHQSTYDSTCSLVAIYNIGTGSGQTGWAPIMGNSYYQNFSGWYKGPTPSGCAADQDALSVITSENGFSYRPDDHSDDPSVNPTAVIISNLSFADSGIISTNTDKDIFAFTLTQAGLFHLDANPFSVGPQNAGADLDIKLELINSSYQVLRIYDSINTLNQTIDTTLESGQYFVMVEGSGNSYTSNYGSLGSYNISGTFTPLFVTPIKQVLLSGKTDNDQNILNWSIISDEPLSILTLESSLDGAEFTTLASFPPTSISYSYSPLTKQNIYYRMKAVSATDQTVYSNVISLTINNNQQSLFNVSTMVHSQITVNAGENFNYQIADMSGRILQGGKGVAGTNTININNNPNGIYLIQIISSSQRLTERIVKL